MEELLVKFFSEKGLTALLFFLTLVGVYKLAKFLGKEYIKTYEKNLELQRQAQEKKDLEFLKAVGEMSHIIKNGDDEHKTAHKVLGEKIDLGYKAIGEKIEQVGNFIKYQLKEKKNDCKNNEN